jgi:hypothetical protein
VTVYIGKQNLNISQVAWLDYLKTVLHVLSHAFVSGLV